MNDNIIKPDDVDAMTDAERALAERIAEDRRTVAPFLNVDDARVAAAVARVRQRLAAEIAPPRRVIRIGTWSAAAAAAVAIGLLTVALWTASNPAGNGGNQQTIVAHSGNSNGGDNFADDPLAELLTTPLAFDAESESLELLTVLAGELDPQSALDAQLLAMLLDS